MADFSTALQTKIGYFHSKSSTLTEGTQEVYEPLYKSAHSPVGELDVWADSVGYAVNAAAADAEAGSNSAVTKYTQVDLTAIPGSNNQAWYYDNGGTFVKPWISPRDIPNSTTQAPSYGYQMLLYQQDLTLVTPTEGRWAIDYYSGIVQFEVGFTPSDMGWATPIKGTIYAYTGTFGGGSGSSSFGVTQAAHGFTTLTAIYHDGAQWQLADASASASLGTHIVTAVAGVNDFTAAALGRFTITGHGLTVGNDYFVSDTVPGAITDTNPATYSNPILSVEDANTIHVLHYRASQSGALGIELTNDGIEEAKIAGEAITANYAVYIDSLTEEVFLADRTQPTHEDRVYGIARNSALITEQVDVRTFGELEDATWTWTPTLPIYVDTAGTMTQVAPAAGFSKVMGYAITATKMFVHVNNPAVDESIGSYPDFKLDGGPIITVPSSGWYELDGGSIV